MGQGLLHGARQSGNIFPPGTQYSALNVTQFENVFLSLDVRAQMFFELISGFPIMNRSWVFRLQFAND